MLPLLQQASVLAKRYDAVIANPPYMGSKFYTDNLKSFINSDYKCSKSDLYSAFIEKAYNTGREREHIVKLTSIQPALNPIPFPDM
ncbi:BREX-1 system adenine-specific DNA-methyltransferase PglX, partial [Aeromonas veronii]|uniref:BREX-1 system adenine-specific DNA-methyltransferase PglX n=1 Tax=Aeromonas veronii TaxID=654 RepID=UPI00214D49C5